MMIAAMQGRHDEADTLLAELKLTAPSEMFREYAEAVAWFSRGDFEKARAAYERVLEIDPENHDLHFEYASICADVDDIPTAESAYLRAIEGNKENAAAWLYLSNVQLRREKYAEAEASARQALRLRPDDYRAWRMLAVSLLNQEQFTDDCEDALRQSVGNDVEASEDVFRWILRWQVNRIETVASARAAAARYGHFEIHSHIFLANLALTVIRHGWVSLLPKAESWARSAVEKEPSTGYFRMTLALVLAVRDCWSEAFDEAKKALENDVVSPMLVRWFFDLAAAMGHVAESLAVLSASPAAKEFEPLVVALQILNGETPNAPYEMMEVAKDIVKQIDSIRPKAEDSQPPALPNPPAPKRKAKR